MQPTTFEEALDLIWKEQRELIIRKQRDYGSNNISVFGELGVLVRTWDKVERLKTLLTAGKEPENESVDDSWKDVMNYALIALLVRRGIWGLPLEASDHV